MAGKQLVIYNKSDNSIWGYIALGNPDDAKFYPPDPDTQVALEIPLDSEAPHAQDKWHIKDGKLEKKVK